MSSPNPNVALPTLRTQVFALIATALMLSGSALYHSQYQNQYHANNRLKRISTLTHQRDTLDKQLIHLLTYHQRSIDLLTGQPTEEERPSQNRVSKLITSYHRETKRSYAKVTKTAQQWRILLSPQSKTLNEGGEKKLLQQQLEILLMRFPAHIDAVTAVMDTLLNATVADADTKNNINEAKHELIVVGRQFEAAIRTCTSLLRRSFSQQMEDILTHKNNSWLGVFFLLSGCLLVFLSLRLLTSWRQFIWLSNMDPMASSTLIPMTPAPNTYEIADLQNKYYEIHKFITHQRRQLDSTHEEIARLALQNRRNERTLALLELYHGNLINSLDSGVVVTDGDGRVTAMNRSIREMYLDQAGIGDTISSLEIFIALKQRIKIDELQWSTVFTEELKASDILHYKNLKSTLNGQPESLVDLSISAYKDASGAVRGWIWIIYDVTDSVRIKNQLLASGQLAEAGRLSAQVAHEVRNPLSAIGLNAELLEDEFALGLKEPHKQEALTLLRAIGSEIERLTHITDAYLQLARGPRNAKEPAPLNEMLRDLLLMLEADYRSKGITLCCHYSAGDPYVIADSGQIRQALLNILGNSSEAMTSGGMIEITIDQTKQHDTSPEIQPTSNKRLNNKRLSNKSPIPINIEYGTICIRDRGQGLNPHTADRVFEPFFTTKTEGTGLGLYTCKQIIEEHGGSITIENYSSDNTTTISGVQVMIKLPKTCDT